MRREGKIGRGGERGQRWGGERGQGRGGGQGRGEGSGRVWMEPCRKAGLGKVCLGRAEPRTSAHPAKCSTNELGIQTQPPEEESKPMNKQAMLRIKGLSTSLAGPRMISRVLWTWPAPRLNISTTAQLQLAITDLGAKLTEQTDPTKAKSIPSADEDGNATGR